ncbi:hypothetical protein ACAX43_14190 [Paraburkholderia sp. IW21]|uniref:hypothetical protein n=1 Tax=Paraburkholderia sp. IW21 TaxID=3242488 RepID=UPI0035214862
MEKKRADVARTSARKAEQLSGTTRDGECMRRIAGVTGSPTGGGRTAGDGAEMPIGAAGATDAGYSYFNMMH